MSRNMTRSGAGGRLTMAPWAMLTLAVLAAGCPGEGTPHSAPPDSSAIAEPPAAPRIVSLSPLATRFLSQLGLEDRLVRLAGAGEPGTADLDAIARLDPDFVFLPALPEDRTALAPLEAVGARVVEFAPHDLEDLLALCHGIGVELAGSSGVEAFERRVLRPVALVAGQSSPTNRLRTVALVAIDPPEIAGGHSFETDLIEVAGATSLTHGGDDPRRPIDREGLAAMKPDLVLVMTETPPTPEERERVLDLTYGIAPVDVFPFARETFWLDEPVRDATRLRERIVAAERERAAPTEP